MAAMLNMLPDAGLGISQGIRLAPAKAKRGLDDVAEISGKGISPGLSNSKADSDCSRTVIAVEAAAYLFPRLIPVMPVMLIIPCLSFCEAKWRFRLPLRQTADEFGSAIFKLFAGVMFNASNIIVGADCLKLLAGVLVLNNDHSSIRVGSFSNYIPRRLADHGTNRVSASFMAFDQG